jgi:hypothetical protein
VHKCAELYVGLQPPCGFGSWPLSARLRVGLRVCTQHWHTHCCVPVTAERPRVEAGLDRPVGASARGSLATPLWRDPHASGRPPEATALALGWHIMMMPVPRAGCMWARRPSAWVGRRGGKSPGAQPRRSAAAMALLAPNLLVTRTLLGTFIGLCRPSGLKFENLFAVWYSSTPLYSLASEIITARSTVRVELQSEIHFQPRMHVTPEIKSIPFGLADGGSTAPLLPRHVRLRHCAVLRFLRLPRCLLM